MNRKMLLFVLSGVAFALLASPAGAVFIGVDLDSPSTTGSVSPPGVQPPGPLTISGGGTDIWGNADQGYYWYDAFSGNFLATVRIDTNYSGTGGNTWRKAGIMVRTDTSAGSPFVFLETSPQSPGTGVQWRDSAGAAAAWSNAMMSGSPGSASAPYWLQLKRSGTNYTAYWAPDVAGSPGAWTGDATNGLHSNAGIPTNATVGIAITAHDTGVYSAMGFSNFSVVALANPIARLDPQTPGSPNVMGAAYAQVPPSGPVQGPVHWELWRYTSAPGCKVEWWTNNNSWTGNPNYTYTSTDAYAGMPGNYPISNKGNRPGGSGAPLGYPDQFVVLYGSNPSGSEALNTYSVRWSGEIYVGPDFRNGSGQAWFGMNSDDRSYLRIDGTTIMDWGGNNDWDTTPPFTTGTGPGNPIALSVGWHTFEYNQQEGSGGDDGRLRWYNFALGQWSDIDASLLRTMSATELLASGDYNVGDPITSGILGNVGSRPEDFLLQLRVSYQGSTAYSELVDYMGMPEPASCLLLAGGLVALARRRRKAAAQR